MNRKARQEHAARVLPADVADVALVAAETCAGIGDASVSWWHEEVRTGRAPKPVIQQPRFTRWKLADVRRFWADRAAASDAAAGERLAARAKTASLAAQAKRAAAATD